MTDRHLPRKPKFGILEGETERPYTHPPVYFRQNLNDGSQRLVLGGPATSYTELMSDLAATLHETLKILYVLVVPRDGTAEAGRYESPDFLTIEGVDGFLREFSEFLEGDGRHHLWIACPGHGNLVFDRHNVVYAYGDLDAFEAVARANGMKEGLFEVPSPHWHKYHAEYDGTGRGLLARWEWIRSPLRPEDEA